jgi:ATP-dependent protease ClpP protease subunit
MRARGVRAHLPRLSGERPGRPAPLRRFTDVASVEDAGDAVDVLIYDAIDAWGGQWGISAAEVAAALAPYSERRLRVRINSGGGDVFDGQAIYNSLLQHAGAVDVVVEGLAASAASLIAMAGDSVTMMRTSTMMIHDAWGLTIGNAADHEKAAEVLHLLSDQIADVYARRAGGDLDEWRARMRAETWLTAAQAAAIGLVDEVRDPPRGRPEPNDDPAEIPAARMSAGLAAALVRERNHRSWTDSRT